MIYHFGDCDLDTERFEVRRAGSALEVEPQVFDLLCFLVENPDRLITRDELFEALWKGRVVSEAALSTRIKAARQVIGDDGREQAFIRTVHGRGYRFLAAVTIADPVPLPAPKAVPDHVDAVRAGTAAIARGDWDEAYTRLSAIVAGGGASAADLELLAEAQWWTSRLEARLETLERAHELHLRQDNVRRAAFVAMLLAEQHGYMLSHAVASGWLHRAERLLQAEPPSLEHGYLARFKGRLAFDRDAQFDRAIALAEEGYALAVRFRDRDLEMVTLLDQGLAMVVKGDLEPGFALMDEAMAAAMGGELGAMATGRIYCNMIDACMRLGDYRRAVEWDHEADRWCTRFGHLSGFPGVCRVRRAEIRRLSGSWTEAEADARRACVELARLGSFAAMAFYEVGELCLSRGALEEAETAFRRAHELGREPQPGLARLRLAEGNQAAARALVSQALAADTTNRLGRARILPVQVESALAAGDLDAAQAAAEELRSIAETYRTAPLQAAALAAEGSVQLARGDPRGSIASLRQACQIWNENGLPFEEARARLVLGAGYRQLGVAENAAMEIAAATAIFERLGASLELRRAVELAERARD